MPFSIDLYTENFQLQPISSNLEVKMCQSLTGEFKIHFLKYLIDNKIVQFKMEINE